MEILMQILVEFILEIVVEGSYYVSTTKSIHKKIRYPIAAIISLILVAAGAGAFWFAYISYMHSILLSLLFYVISFGCIVLIYKFIDKLLKIN